MMQIMVKQWPEMVEASSRYDPRKAPWRSEKVFWRCPGGSGGGHIRGGHWSDIKVLTVLSGVLFSPQKKPKMTIFGSFSGLSEP